MQQHFEISTVINNHKKFWNFYGNVLAILLHKTKEIKQYIISQNYPNSNSIWIVGSKPYSGLLGKFIWPR